MSAGILLPAGSTRACLDLLATGIALSTQALMHIVQILANSLDYGDSSACGATAHETPRIDRRTKEGRLFTDTDSR